jgi:predicted DNA-binding transcriptional regulator AlpA
MSISKKQLAVLLGHSTKTIERMVASNDLPPPSRTYPVEWCGAEADALAAKLMASASMPERLAGFMIQSSAALGAKAAA